MKNPDLTNWLQIVWDALAEQDRVRRNSMLRAADRFLKGSNQAPLVFPRTRIGKYGRGESPGRLVQPKQAVELRARN